MRIRDVGPALLLTLLLPQIACAQVVITEIMYDPSGTDSGHEWVEVYNGSSIAIPLSKWRIFENDANHNILASSGTVMLAPEAFAVIAQNAAKFRSDHPDFSGQLFHSAFSFDNGGEVISLKDASGTIVESASYDSTEGALGDGNSLQRPPDDAAQFSPHTPTPGAVLSTSVIPAKAKQSAPPKPAKVKKTAPVSSRSGADMRSTAPVPSLLSQAASAAPAASNDPRWLFAVFVLAAAASGAIVAMRHFKKQEWDIVEEMPEDV